MAQVQKILLISGWGVGTQPLESFQTALLGHGFQVDLIDIFDALDPVCLAKQITLAEQYDVIMGWSLGGQLATLLAQGIYAKNAVHKTLITLTSNPCFVANHAWDIGMPASTFLNFQQSFEKAPLVTLKRFCYLVTQGGMKAKQDWQYLQALMNDDHKYLKIQGLELLHSLNTVDILKKYTGQQYHIFAEDDGLVSCKVVEIIKKLDAKFLSVDTISGSHGVIIFQAKALSDKIAQYLKKNSTILV